MLPDLSDMFRMSLCALIESSTSTIVRSVATIKSGVSNRVIRKGAPTVWPRQDRIVFPRH